MCVVHVKLGPSYIIYIFLTDKQFTDLQTLFSC